MCKREVGIRKADRVGRLAPHPLHAALKFQNIRLGPPRRRERRCARLDREANFGEIAEKALVDAGVEMPGQHVGIEHVPGAALAHHRADPRLGA